MPGSAVLAVGRAIVSTYSIVLLGYVGIRAELLSPNSIFGLSQLVARLALPAQLFLAVATLDLGSIDSSFTLAVSLGKLCTGLLAVAVAVLTSQSQRRTMRGAAWLYFTTLSNDLAIGVPMAVALGDSLGGDYTPYIFLQVAVGVLLFLPASVVLMSVGEAKVTATAGGLARAVAAKLATSPIVVMVVLGALSNAALGNDGLPETVTSAIQLLASAFIPSTLLVTGMRMAGKGSLGSKRRSVIASVLLVLLSSVVLPLLIVLAVSLLMDGGGNTVRGTEGGISYADFGFIYGCLPAAPEVLVVAGQFALSAEDRGTLAAAIPLNLLVAAPMLLVSSVVLTNNDSSSLIEAVRVLATTVDSASVLGGLWLLVGLRRSGAFAHDPMSFVWPMAWLALARSVAGIAWESSGSAALYGVSVFFDLCTAGCSVVLALVLRRELGALDSSLAAIRTWAWRVVPLVAAAGAALLPALLRETETADRTRLSLYGRTEGFMLMGLFSALCLLLLAQLLSLQPHKRRRAGSRHDSLTASLLAGEERPTDSTVSTAGATPRLTGSSGHTASTAMSIERTVLPMRFRHLKRRIEGVVAYYAMTAAVGVALGSVLASETSSTAAALQVEFVFSALHAGQGLVLCFAFASERNVHEAMVALGRELEALARARLYGVEAESAAVGVAATSDARLRSLVGRMAEDPELVAPHEIDGRTVLTCACGADIVSWLIVNREVVDRNEGALLGQSLVAAGLLRSRRGCFVDDAGYIFELEEA